MNLAAILAAITGIEAIVKLINSARKTALQTGELTTEQDAEFDAKLESAFKSDHWQP